MKDGSYQYYAGNFVYGNDKQVDYILFEEGKVDRNEQGGMVYNYFIKDHLGNTRVSFTLGTKQRQLRIPKITGLEGRIGNVLFNITLTIKA